MIATVYSPLIFMELINLDSFLMNVCTQLYLHCSFFFSFLFQVLVYVKIKNFHMIQSVNRFKEKKIWQQAKDISKNCEDQKMKDAVSYLSRLGRSHWQQTDPQLNPTFCKNKKTKQKQMTCDMWHVTCETSWGVNFLSKCQPPSSYGLG